MKIVRGSYMEWEFDWNLTQLISASYLYGAGEEEYLQLLPRVYCRLHRSYDGGYGAHRLPLYSNPLPVHCGIYRWAEGRRG